MYMHMYIYMCIKPKPTSLNTIPERAKGSGDMPQIQTSDANCCGTAWFSCDLFHWHCDPS